MQASGGGITQEDKKSVQGAWIVLRTAQKSVQGAWIVLRTALCYASIWWWNDNNTNTNCGNSLAQQAAASL